MSNSSQVTIPYPRWLPPDFIVDSGNLECSSPAAVLKHFGLYNGIAIIFFLVTRSPWVDKLFTRRSRKDADHWSFWSSLSILCFQLLGIILTSLLILKSDYHGSIGQMVQLWALRPRVTWFTGNLAHFRVNQGYMNGAHGHLFTEVFICSIASVFLGRVVATALANPPETYPNTDPQEKYRVMIITAGIFMLVSTAGEVLWALWMSARVISTRGRPEAQDMNSLRWIATMCVPVTAVSSWLVWAAYLYGAEGYYCPGNVKWIDLIWTLLPFLSNSTAVLVDQMRR